MYIMLYVCIFTYIFDVYYVIYIYIYYNCIHIIYILIYPHASTAQRNIGHVVTKNQSECLFLEVC